MKLHLGCYNKKIHGWTNVDCREEVNPDVVDDCIKLEKFKDDSADIIYSCHMLEHTSRKDTIVALKRWFAVLKSGGTLRLAVPDLEMAFKYYILYGNLKDIENILYGSQKHHADFHYNGFDFKTLKGNLESVGFKNVRRYDWRDTEHNFVDDYSQSYLKEISYKTRRKEGEIGGVLMSLNVEATKP